MRNNLSNRDVAPNLPRGKFQGAAHPASEVFARIDPARALQPGAVSRNMRIAEAVQEKQIREFKNATAQPKPVAGG